MATVSPQVPITAGTTPTYSTASGGGDLINLDPAASLVLVVKTGGTGTTVTLTTPGTVNGLAIADNAITIGTNSERWIPLPYSLYADANGQCAVAWSAVTSVTFAVVRM